MTSVAAAVLTSMLTAAPAERALTDAVRANDLVKVQRLIAAGADPNAGFEDDWATPLTYAAQHGHLELVQLLVSSGAEIDRPRKYGFTPLMDAAANGRLETVKWLLAHGAKVNQSSRVGLTPFILAQRRNDRAVLAALISAGADQVDEPTEEAAVDLTGSAPPCSEKRALAAAHAGRLSALEPCAPHLSRKTLGRALLEAAEMGRLDVVKLLLASGAPVDARGVLRYTPLMQAARRNNTEVVEALLDAGADVNARYHSQWPADEGTALMLAANDGHLETVSVLLERGADVNARGAERDTALHWAAREGRDDVVELLVRAGAKLDVENDDRSTPADLAAREGYPGLAARLRARAR